MICPGRSWFKLDKSNAWLTSSRTKEDMQVLELTLILNKKTMTMSS